MGIKASGSKPVTAIKPPLWNRVVESMLDSEQRRLGKGLGSRPNSLFTDTIKVKNDSGGDLARGAALEIGSNLLTGLSDLDPDNLWFSGVTATADNRPFGILRQATPSLTIDDCQVSGKIITRVNITDANHKRCYLKSGATNLESSDTGSAQILYKPTGTGVKECVVLLHNPAAAGVEIKLAITDDFIPGRLRAPTSGSYQYPQYYAGDVKLRTVTLQDITDTPWNEMISGSTIKREGYGLTTSTTYNALNLLPNSLKTGTYVQIVQIDSQWCIIGVIGEYNPEVWLSLSSYVNIDSTSTINIASTGGPLNGTTADAADYVFAGVPSSAPYIKIMEQGMYNIGYSCDVTWGNRAGIVQSLTIGLSMHEDDGAGAIPAPTKCLTYPNIKSDDSILQPIMSSTQCYITTGTYNMPIRMKLTASIDSTSGYVSYPLFSNARVWIRKCDWGDQSGQGRGNA